MFFEGIGTDEGDLFGDVEEGVEELFGEDGHLVDEGVQRALLVEDEDRRRVIVAHALRLVVVVVYAVEVDRVLSCLCELLELAAKLLAAVTVMRVVVDDLVGRLLQDGLVLFAGDLLCPSIRGLLGGEVLFGLSLLALSEPLLQMLPVNGFTANQVLILEGIGEEMADGGFRKSGTGLVGLQALGRVIVLLEVDGGLLHIRTVVQRLRISPVLFLRQFCPYLRLNPLTALVFVHVDVKDVVSRWQRFLEWREDEDVLENGSGCIHSRHPFPVDGEEISLISEVLPQVVTVNNQQEHTFLLDPQYPPNMLVLHYKLAQVFSFNLVQLLEGLELSFGGGSLVVLGSIANQCHVIRVILYRCQLSSYIFKPNFAVQVQTFNQPAMEGFAIGCEIRTGPAPVDVGVDVDESFPIGSVEDEVVLLILLLGQSVAFLQEDELEVAAHLSRMSAQEVLSQSYHLLVNEAVPRQLEEDYCAITHQQSVHVGPQVTYVFDAGVSAVSERGE